MSLLPSFLFRTRAHTTVLKLRSFNHFIRVWLRRPPECPSAAEDYTEMSGWVLANRAHIDQQAPEELIADMFRLFPRVCRVEVMNGSGTEGVVAHV